MIQQFLLVAAGSAAGGMLRYGLSFLGRSYPAPFPYWTFVANLLGSFLIGMLIASTGPESERFRLLMITGFCGGFTTFSAFSLETLELFEQGMVGWAGLNILLSVLFGIVGCLLGYRLGS